jgi:trigger factor
VTKEINRIRESSGKMKEVAEGEVQVKDFVQGDVKVRAGLDAPEDAEVLFHQPGAYVLVNGEDLQFKGHIAGIVIEDLGKTLPGKKVGDVFTTSLTGPAVHEVEKFRGQPVTVSLKIEKLHRVDAIPEDKLHEQMGLESFDAVKKRIKDALESRRDRQQQASLHEQVSKYLLDNVELSLPEGLTSRQALRILRRTALDMAYKGTPQEEIDLKLAELRKTSEDEARKQLKLFFVLDAASKQLEVQVDDQEINGRIAMLAYQQNRRPEKLRQEMVRNGEIENLFLQIREQKTLDKIITKAKISEGPAPTAA